MCRFLLFQSRELINPKGLLLEFSAMAKKSKALDGDWQGDGWGVAWIDKTNKWQLYKSLKPVWEETLFFDTIAYTRAVSVHARSATFPKQKGIIEYNQPYISGSNVFVFNGLLKGVSLANIPGKIGAEKIWYLLQQQLKVSSPEDALLNVKKLLLRNSREIIALNIGLSTSEKMYTLNYFSKSPGYYRLFSYKDDRIQLACSEKIDISKI